MENQKGGPGHGQSSAYPNRDILGRGEEPINEDTHKRRVETELRLK